MKHVFCDASFDYRHTDSTDEPVVRGKIAIVSDDFKVVERIAIGKVEGLRQYINILELIAIARAIEMGVNYGWEKYLTINTDSMVARAWARRGKFQPKSMNEAHKSAIDYLNTVKKLFGGTIEFVQIPRDKNPAGHLLEAELEREAPHAV